MDPRDAVTVPEADGDELAAPSRLGRFELGRKLGEGGMGVVFEARDALLDRSVALKLLRPSARGGSAGLVREAQALARLVHPNVVTVFDIGSSGDDIFIAMELVEGSTLREWIQRGHEWRETIDVFIAAGRGLAAVHALGLVHRDFKPSNVLLGSSGAPKVSDFGLVCHEGAAAVLVGGTPAYMPPEQARGEPLDGRADQFAFATSLAEAVGDRAPSRLRAILERARAEDPGARYPSMAALLAELALVRRGRLRWWVTGGAAVAVVATVAAAWSLGRAQTTPDPCPAPEVAAWNPAGRDAVRAHLAGIDAAQGPARFDAVARAVDPFVHGWRDMRVSACRATRVEGRQSDRLLDRRMACLDRARAELDETIAIVERAADPAGLDAAMHAVVALPALDACGDAQALGEQLAPPVEVARRAEYDAIAREGAAIDVQRRVDGRLQGLEDRARALLVRARRLDHAPSVAAVLNSLALIQLEHEEADPALGTLRDAIQAAAAARDDRIAADAWVRTLAMLVGPLHRLDDAELLMPSATAAITRAGGHADQRFDLLLIQSQLAMFRGDEVGAHALLDDAVALLGDRDPERSSAARLQAANLEARAGHWQAAVDGYRAFVDGVTVTLGPDHPDVLRATFNLGVCLRRLDRDEEALAAFRTAARIGEARLAPSPNLASLLHGVGSTLTDMGLADEALPYLERAVAMARATLTPGERGLAKPIGDLGAALSGLGRDAEARAAFAEQIELYERAGEPDPDWPNALYNLAELDVRAGDCAAAIAEIDRALARYAADSPDRADAVELRGVCTGRAAGHDPR